MSGSTAGEGQVPRLLLAVVAVHLGEEGVGVGVLRGHLLEQVRDLLAGEHHHVQQRRVPGDPSGAEAVQAGEDRMVHQRVVRHRSDLTDHPLEQPLVACLLAHLVQQVRDGRVGEVGRPGHLEREARLEHRLEADPGVEHGSHLLAGECAALLGVELDAGPVDGQQLVRHQLTVADAAGQVAVRVDDPSLRHPVEPLDAVGHDRRRHVRTLNRRSVGYNVTAATAPYLTPS